MYIGKKKKNHNRCRHQFLLSFFYFKFFFYYKRLRADKHVHTRTFPRAKVRYFLTLLSHIDEIGISHFLDRKIVFLNKGKE